MLPWDSPALHDFKRILRGLQLAGPAALGM